MGEIRFQGLRSALVIIIIIVDVLLVNACHNISPLFSVHREIAQRHPGNRKTVYYRTPCNKRLVSDLIKTFFVSRIKVEISLTAQLFQIVLNSPQWIGYFSILLSRFPYHEETTRITTPPWMGYQSMARTPPPPPLAIHQA